MADKPPVGVYDLVHAEPRTGELGVRCRFAKMQGLAAVRGRPADVYLTRGEVGKALAAVPAGSVPDSVRASLAEVRAWLAETSVGDRK